VLSGWGCACGPTPHQYRDSAEDSAHVGAVGLALEPLAW
jgi:hypothetical protein